MAFERGGDIFVKQVDGEALVQLTGTGLSESAPAWSPDGRQIAFTREGQGIFVISPLGGGERKVADTRVPLLLKSIAWTPDARSLVISEMTSPICASLFVISIETGQKTRLTSPPEPSIGDGWPAVSPDGRTRRVRAVFTGHLCERLPGALSGGEPRQLTADKASIFGLAWTPDANLVLSSDRGGSLSSLAPLREARFECHRSRRWTSPARMRDFHRSRVGRTGTSTRLAYQRLVENMDIRRAEIVGEGTPSTIALVPAIHRVDEIRHIILAIRRTERRFAFVSRRSGTYEIWLCTSDGSNPVRLTSMEDRSSSDPTGRRMGVASPSSPQRDARAHIGPTSWTQTAGHRRA